MNTQEMIQVSRGLVKAEFVLKNATIVNVLSGELEEADIAIHQGIIVGIGQYKGEVEHDLEKRYVAPGFIDGHVHIESSMSTPLEFAKMVLPKGTTTVIADPHEIANVCGKNGISFMLDSSERIPLNVYMMIPSCVPATKFENSGAVITANDIKSFKNHPRVLGLGEVMDYPSVIEGNANILEKIDTMKNRIIDGHAPDISGKDLNAYMQAGVMTDHECTLVESLTERVRRGMYVHLREGSATRNVKTLLKGVTKNNIHRLLFCTDDKHPEDVFIEGHINYNVNLAIAHGIEPIDAIRMATINAANCYGLNHLGAIAIHRSADLIVFEDMKKIEPIEVYKGGVLVAKNNHPLFEGDTVIPKTVKHTVHVDVSQIDLSLKIKSNPVHVIGLIKDNITTTKLIRHVKLEDNQFVYDEAIDVLKLAVIERHHMTKNIGLGLVEGFGIQNGAIAMTIAHDSHNLVCIGTDDQQMKMAIEKIVDLEGGIVIVNNHKIVEFLKLEIAGLMTSSPVKEVQETLKRMKKSVVQMGLSNDISDPFISLSFLALPVIPILKLTDQGLFDVEAFQMIPIEVKEGM
jgi:adenine deaminase